MVESSLCPSCSSPVQAGQILCTVCGELLVPDDASRPDASGRAAQGKTKTTESGVDQVGATPAASPAPADEAATMGPTETSAVDTEVDTQADPRLAALGIEPAALLEQQLEPAGDASEGTGGSNAPPMAAPEPSALALHPSNAGSMAGPNGPSMSLSVGAIPVSSIDAAASAVAPAVSAAPVPAPAAQSAAAPVPAPAAQSAIWPSAPVAPGTAAAESAVGPASTVPPPAPAGPSTVPPPALAGASPLPPFAASAGYERPTPPAALGPSAPVAAESPLASGEPARKESARELIAFGLVAAGAALGIGSLFLPWANELGTSVMMTETTAPHQWGWGMPAGISIFLLSTLVLGAVSGSDRAQAKLPRLSLEIGRVTSTVMPLILGGLDLGVFLLYWGFPWGFGGGLFVLLLGAVSLIAGAIVALFFPPETPPERI